MGGEGNEPQTCCMCTVLLLHIRAGAGQLPLAAQPDWHLSLLPRALPRIVSRDGKNFFRLSCKLLRINMWLTPPVLFWEGVWCLSYFSVAWNSPVGWGADSYQQNSWIRQQCIQSFGAHYYTVSLTEPFPVLLGKCLFGEKKLKKNINWSNIKPEEH